jgi:hypothetical protein
MEPSFLFNMLTRQKKTVDFNIKGYKSMDFDLFGPDYLIVEASMELIIQTIVVPYLLKKLQYITPIINVNNFMFAHTYLRLQVLLTLIMAVFIKFLGINLFCKPVKYECNCPAINQIIPYKSC